MKPFISKLVCFILAGLSVMICSAQKKADSKAGLLAKASFGLIGSMPDSALKLAEAGLAAATEEHNQPGYASCLNAKAMALYRLGRNDSAGHVFRAAIAAFESLHNKQDAARSLINLSILYTDQALYEQAMQAVLKAKAYMESASDKSGKAYAEKMIGILYRQQGNYDQAILYLRVAVHDFEHTKDTIYVADAMSTLGSVYTLTGNTDSAFYYYHKSLSIYEGLQNTNGMAFINENIGDAYYKLANGTANRWIDSALHYYRTAFALFEKLHSSQSVAYEQMMIGNALLAKGNVAPAVQYFREALAVFDAEQSYSYAAQTLAQLRVLEGNAGHYRQAFEYASKELVYKDTLASGNRKEVMAAMFAKYEVDKRDRTIALLHAQEKLNAQELHHRRTMEVTYLVLGLVAIILALLLLNFYRVRQQLKEVKMRNQLANDLHDDVGSSLSSILLLSKMALAGNSDSDARTQIITTIRHNAGEVIERMSDIVWTTDPRFDKSADLSARMEHYLQQARQGTSLVIRADIPDDVANASFPMDIRKNIFLIFKEAVNNVLKHAGATELSIFFGERNGSLQLRICDNGKGFSPGLTYSGIGLDTMRQRAAVLKASLTIGQQEGGGTCILLRMPAKRYRQSIRKKLYHG